MFFTLIKISIFIFLSISLNAGLSKDFHPNLSEKVRFLSTDNFDRKDIDVIFDPLEENNSLIFKEEQKSRVQAGSHVSSLGFYYLRYQWSDFKNNVSVLMNRLNSLEHQHSGEHRPGITKIRNFTYIVITSATVVIWSFKPDMDWSDKSVAMMLGTLGNWFFIYYENILDAKIFDHPLPQKVFRVPVNIVFHMKRQLVGLFAASNMHDLGKKVSYWSSEAGRFFMMSLVNGLFIYSYQYLQSNSSSFFSGEIALESLKALSYYVATGIIYAFPRGNLKKFGRKYFNELSIHKMSAALNIGVGASFILLVANVINENLVLGFFGLSGLAMTWATNEHRLEKTSQWVKKLSPKACKQVF
jgi:hypothetical protein